MGPRRLITVKHLRRCLEGLVLQFSLFLRRIFRRSTWNFGLTIVGNSENFRTFEQLCHRLLVRFRFMSMLFLVLGSNLFSFIVGSYLFEIAQLLFIAWCFLFSFCCQIFFLCFQISFLCFQIFFLCFQIFFLSFQIFFYFEIFSFCQIFWLFYQTFYPFYQISLIFYPFYLTF